MTVKPYFNNVKLQGMFLSITLTKKRSATIDQYLQEVKKLMGHLIVFEKCPRCGREVPAIDMTKYGYCYICYAEKEQNEGRS